MILVCSIGGNELGVDGAKIMADLLKTNTTLTSVGYAAGRLSPYCQHPLTSFLTACMFVHFHDSLRGNKLTNYGRDMSGIIQLAEALKMNEGLTSLKYVPALSQTPIKQASAPADSARLLCTPLLQLGRQRALRDQIWPGHLHC